MCQQRWRSCEVDPGLSYFAHGSFQDLTNENNIEIFIGL